MVKNNSEWFSPSPVINLVRRINVYETKNEYIIIGSNNNGSRFKILRVDRNEIKKLNIINDEKEYNNFEISKVINKIMDINKKYKKISAFGLIGFVRFLEGYYLILISSRRRVAMLGAHSIYKILDTTMFYIPNSTNKTNPDEIKYLKMFQNVDLNSNFYFSYSYDISHTLQYNLTPLNFYEGDINKQVLEKFSLESKFNCCCENENNEKFANNDNNFFLNQESSMKNEISCKKCNINKNYAIRTQPNYKFIWNEYLLEPANLHQDWLIYLIHGYVGQTILNEFNEKLYLTLIARRSQKFAGTRFLKRGINQDGNVANEVETEQILSQVFAIDFNKGKFSSYVHIRGSVPSHWSQDISKMVPKPQILIDIVDPFSIAAGKHFNKLLSCYGSPIFVLNLVKMKESRPQEILLTKELIQTISYLNQFLPPKFHIQYIGMDMARINKSKDKNVLQNLSIIAYNTIKKNGIFQLFNNDSNSKFNLIDCEDFGGYKLKEGLILQTGIVRVNCVDCLDRTNTAAFVLGKTALAFQLYALGLVNDPFHVENDMNFENKITKKLEKLYEEHGDTLALQYGGSQLVHRIKTYKKKAQLTSQSRDFMQTISRYYSNTFSDSDKQNAINLFLGVFRAYSTLNYCNLNQSIFLNNSNHIWDMTTDFYLHNINTLRRHVFNLSRLYTKWWDEKMILCLPRACNEVFKGLNNNIKCVLRKKNRLIKLDSDTDNLIYDQSTNEYNEFYKCCEYTSFDSLNYFELLKYLKENNQNCSNSDFNIFSSMFNNVFDTVLNHFKFNLTSENNENNNLNEVNNSESSDGSSQKSLKIQIQDLTSNDYDSSYFKDNNFLNYSENKKFIDDFKENTCNSTIDVPKDKNEYFFKNLSKLDSNIYYDYIEFGIKSGEFCFYENDYLNKSEDKQENLYNYKEDMKNTSNNNLEQNGFGIYCSSNILNDNFESLDTQNVRNMFQNSYDVSLSRLSKKSLKLMENYLNVGNIWNYNKRNDFYSAYLNTKI